MQVRAVAKYVRMSPRKVRLVVDAVRGKSVNEALTILQFIPNAAAKAVAKVVKSAAANADNNYNLSIADLFISHITADPGPTLPKRFRAVSRGRAHPIRRRSSHITVIVEEKEE
ncbi:MAG: 50S ribosomal protein L22 [Chloroflexi bacterium]|nr:50S ribosomal protein L22 [Chloroflexota bacterium]MCL5074966.1 50S ribosomal protein L22 [Chloroflexota bacterium]